MKFKGTKGKWSVERHLHQLCGDYLIIDENDYQLAIADNEYIQDYEKTKANALLISKAPEMLEMLRSVLELQISNYGSATNTHLDLIGKAKEIERLIKEATEIN